MNGFTTRFYRLSLVLPCLFAMNGLTASAQAYDASDLHRLLATNTCQNCDLRGINLKRARLHGADLRGSDLTDSYFYRVNLHDAQLQGATLTGTFMKRVNLQGADFSHANLDDAIIIGSNLSHTDFSETSRDNALILWGGGWLNLLR